jgi:hypothetical protein
MLLYFIAAAIGFLVSQIYMNSRPSILDRHIFGYLKAGKRVVIAVGDDATIFQPYGNRVRVYKAELNLGDGDVNYMDDLSSDKPDQHFSELP